MSKPVNREFEMKGINHLALVCKDMQRTVDFYTGKLGMPLVKAIDLPGGRGQHFFFDVGNGDCIAFFYFVDAPERAPGIASASALPTQGNFVTAHGSMNHVAINVPLELFDAYHEKLKEKGLNPTIILNHDHSATQTSATMNDDVYVRSIYFFDPDGICLEFAAWTREFNESDIGVAPARAVEKEAALA